MTSKTIQTKKPRRTTREVVERAIELSKIAVGTWDELLRRGSKTESDVADDDMTSDAFKNALKRVSRPLKKENSPPDSEKIGT